MENRREVERFVADHLAESNAVAVASGQGIPPVSSAAPSADQRTSDALARAGADRFALLEGLDPAAAQAAETLAADPVSLAGRITSGITLSELLAVAAVRSPGAVAASESWRAALTRIEQAEFLEGLLVAYRGFVRELDTRIGPETNRPMASMTQPWPALTALKGEVVRNEVALARNDYEMTLRETLNRATSLWFELQYAHASVDALEESRAIYAQTVPVVQAQVEAGAAAQSDLLRVQSEQGIIDVEARNARSRIRMVSAELNALLGITGVEAWPRPEPTDLRDDPAPPDSGASRQELRAARIGLELARATLRLAETMTLPRGPSPMSGLSNSAGVEAGADRDMMTTFPESGSAEIRGQDFAANAAYIGELRRRVAEAEARLAQAEAETRAALTAAAVARENARREHRLYTETVEPNAHQAADNTREAYQAGSASFSLFLDVEREHLEASLMREKARMEHNLTIITGRGATGRTAHDLIQVRRSSAQGGNP